MTIVLKKALRLKPVINEVSAGPSDKVEKRLIAAGKSPASKNKMQRVRRDAACLSISPAPRCANVLEAVLSHKAHRWITSRLTVMYGEYEQKFLF